MAKKEGTHVLSMDELLTFNLVEVPIPGLGGSLFMKPPTASDALKYASSITEDGDNSHLIPVLGRLVVNENGDRIFPPGEEDGLGDVPVTVFNALATSLGKLTTIEALDEEGKD